MIYVASPYSSPDKSVEHKRWITVARYVSSLFEKEPHIVRISPIVYWHHTAITFDLGTTAMHYKEFNHALLRECACVEILAMPGWEESKGVQLEREWAKELGLGTNIVKVATKV